MRGSAFSIARERVAAGTPPLISRLRATASVYALRAAAKSGGCAPTRACGRSPSLPADEAHRRRLVILTARQCAIDRYRALLRRGETLPLDDRDDAELAVALESHLESRELMAQIMALPPPDGELFLRRYLYGETAAQLGARFAMPAATVRTRLHRARLALQKLLKEG